MTPMHIFAIHDWSEQWASLVKNTGKTGWTVITEEIGADPTNKSGQDYRHTATYGVTPIVRLNYSHHGTGTIPLPDQYQNFAQRCANFVAASQGCIHWIIGNEPNLRGERFGDIPITPKQYAECFRQCRNAIKLRGTQHQVIVAAVAPYNADTGWCIDYWIEMLDALQITGKGADGLAVHCYSRGANPVSITANDKMGSPYSNYYNGFRAYRDFLNAIPWSMRDLPAYITETDQLDPWVDNNSGWVKAAYTEIDEWNRSDNRPKVSCLALYRWENFDKWGIRGKNGVIKDFKRTLESTDYKVPKTFLPTIETTPISPMVLVNAEGGANIRSGPGMGYSKLGAVLFRTSLSVIGRSADSSWWKVRSEFGEGWVSNTIVTPVNTQNVPVVTVTIPIPTQPTPGPISGNWQRSYDFVRRWEGEYQNVHNDRGNWTGCEVGKGELKGTKYGISACSYPHLDIKNITPLQAEQIFLVDYWQKSGASNLPYPACLVVLDTAVLHGVGAAKAWLAEVGPNAYIFVARRLRSYLKAENWEFWDEAWIGRVIELLEYVGKSV